MPTLSPAQKMRAQVRGWSADLIERAENSAASDKQIDNVLNISIEPDRVSKWLEFVENDPEHPFARAQFIMFEDGGETGLKPSASEDGMRLSDVDIGSYGHVPDVWSYRNDLPRGTRPVPGMYMPAGYAIYDRTEVWAEGVADLYEDAIRDRWIPATDLDWENREELSPEVERATGQICAIYSTYGIAEQKIISKWLEEISYGFHEVKLFLATQVYDAGRKVESLRKRALHGSGIIGKAPLSDVSESWYNALTFTDMIIALDVVYKSYELTAFECATDWARSDFDRDLFARLADDSKRHLEYGLKHLQWYNRYAERAELELPIFFIKAEAGLASEMAQSPLEREALAVLYADGVERLDAGVESLRKLREKQYHDYLHRLHEHGFNRIGEAVGILGLATQDPLLKALNPEALVEGASAGTTASDRD